MNAKRLMIVAVVMTLAIGTVATVSARQDEGETAWLGVQIMDTLQGVVVTAVVPDSPADDAGIAEGDIILLVDETEIETSEQLVDVIQGYAPGDEVVLVLANDDERREVTVTLAERPAQPEIVIEPPVIEMRPGFQGMMNIMGLEATVTDDGLLIEAIDPDSPFANSGLMEGDVITGMNGDPVSDFGPGFMRMFRFDEELTFTVMRDGEEVEIEFELPDMGEIIIEGMPGDIMPMIPGQQPMKLGVSFTMITPEQAEEEELSVEEGALIRQVYDDTAAAEAGLVAGDIVTAVDGDVVDIERTLADRLYAYEAEDVVTLTVLRDGEEIEVEVTLGSGVAMRAPFDGEFFQAHPFMGEMYGHMFEDGEFFEDHPFMDKMFEEMFRGGRHGHGGGMFRMGPDGFHFEFMPDADDMPDIEMESSAADDGPAA